MTYKSSEHPPAVQAQSGEKTVKTFSWKNWLQGGQIDKHFHKVYLVMSSKYFIILVVASASTSGTGAAAENTAVHVLH